MRSSELPPDLESYERLASTEGTRAARAPARALHELNLDAVRATDGWFDVEGERPRAGEATSAAGRS